MKNTHSRKKNIRIEFLWDKNKDITQIFVWNGQQIIDRLEMPGTLSSYQRKKIRKELKKREKEE